MSYAHTLGASVPQDPIEWVVSNFRTIRRIAGAVTRGSDPVWDGEDVAQEAFLAALELAAAKPDAAAAYVENFGTSFASSLTRSVYRSKVVGSSRHAAPAAGPAVKEGRANTSPWQSDAGDDVRGLEIDQMSDPNRPVDELLAREELGFKLLEEESALRHFNLTEEEQAELDFIRDCYTLSEYSERTGIPYRTVCYRFDRLLELIEAGKRPILTLRRGQPKPGRPKGKAAPKGQGDLLGGAL